MPRFTPADLETNPHRFECFAPKCRRTARHRAPGQQLSNMAPGVRTFGRWFCDEHPQQITTPPANAAWVCDKWPAVPIAATTSPAVINSARHHHEHITKVGQFFPCGAGLKVA